MTMGYAPEPLREKTVTEASLAEAIRCFDDPLVQEKASVIGTEIQNENGTIQAVRYLETLVDKG